MIRELPSGRAEILIITTRSRHAVGGQNLHQALQHLLHAPLSADLRGQTIMKTKLLRRQFLHLAAGTVALPAVSRIARAQVYPSRPVRLIVGSAAGGSTDLVGR